MAPDHSDAVTIVGASNAEFEEVPMEPEPVTEGAAQSVPETPAAEIPAVTATPVKAKP